MSSKCQKLEQLIRITDNCKNSVYATNLDFLSNKEIEGYEEKRILLFQGFRAETTCSKCIKGSCTVPVKRVDYPDGRQMAVYMCPDPEHGGRFEIELDQLRYWKVNAEMLKGMGYLTEPEKPAGAVSVVAPKAGRGRPITDKKKESARKICGFVKNSPKEIPGHGKWTFLVDKFKFPYKGKKARRGEALKSYLKRNHLNAYKDLH